jgi:hypothetical protein
MALEVQQIGVKREVGNASLNVGFALIEEGSHLIRMLLSSWIEYLELDWAPHGRYGTPTSSDAVDNRDVPGVYAKVLCTGSIG